MSRDFVKRIVSILLRRALPVPVVEVVELLDDVVLDDSDDAEPSPLPFADVERQHMQAASAAKPLTRK